MYTNTCAWQAGQAQRGEFVQKPLSFRSSGVTVGWVRCFLLCPHNGLEPLAVVWCTQAIGINCLSQFLPFAAFCRLVCRRTPMHERINGSQISVRV